MQRQRERASAEFWMDVPNKKLTERKEWSCWHTQPAPKVHLDCPARPQMMSYFKLPLYIYDNSPIIPKKPVSHLSCQLRGMCPLSVSSSVLG